MASPFRRYLSLARRYRTPLLLASCGGVFSVNMLSHAFPESAFVSLYQAWRGGEPAALSQRLEGVVREVLEESGVARPAGYRAFASYGFQPVAAGLPWLPSGAHIGIPANFNSTPDDPAGITNRTIFINGKEVSWDSEAGAALKEALLFSPEAQKFAVARDVARLEGGGPVLSALVAPLCLAGVWLYSATLKQVFGLHAGPALLLRGGANLAALGLGAVSYLLTNDAVTQWMDYRCDRRAAGLSRRYAQGGVEFYDKVLSRNRVLRGLMGRRGEETYAPNGNLFPAHLLKLSHAPYTARREGILGLLKEEEKEEPAGLIHRCLCVCVKKPHTHAASLQCDMQHGRRKDRWTPRRFAQDSRSVGCSSEEQ